MATTVPVPSPPVSSGDTTAHPQVSKGGASISMITLAVMTVTTVVSLRGLPSQAEFGLSSIFFYVFAAVFFLIPFALVCAELASTFTKSGGIFRWCGEAFGPRWGFAAMFLEWETVVIWFPSVLIFAAVALAYTLWPASRDEALASNRWYTIVVLLIVYWAATLNTFRGIKSAANLSKWGGIIGTIIPGFVLMVLGALWLLRGNPNNLPMDKPFLPDFGNISTIVLAASIFLFYAGMELNAVHVGQLKDPAREFPKAILIASIVIVAIFILGTLAIGVVVPESQINLTQSLLYAFDEMWRSLGIGWMGNVMAVMVAFGVLGQVAVIIAGPSTGLLAVGRAGYLPPKLQETNKNGVQVPIIVVQGVLVTILALILTIAPTVQTAYQILSQLATITYLVMCVIIYASFLKLRYKHPINVVPRGFAVPGGDAAAWFVTVFGIGGVLLALFLSFMPPSQIPTGSPESYIGILVAGAIFFVLLPFIIFALHRASWRNPKSAFEPFGEFPTEPASQPAPAHARS